MRSNISYLVFGNGKHIDSKSLFWNMTFSVTNALQSAIMLLIVTRVCGIKDGGIFSIAYATSQLMYTVGGYSTRTFQATDTRYVYSYRDYSNARFVTCLGMMITASVYCAIRQYDLEKTEIVFAACIYKLIEAIEDLDHGELQREGRLDIAGRIGTFRIVLNDLTFFAILSATGDVKFALIGVAAVAALVVAITHQYYKVSFHREKQATQKKKISRLLWDCFPLFASGCLAMYVSNASKYAIDVYLGDETQTYFSVIFMPVFTINLLSGVCFRPQMKQMADFWNAREFKRFQKMIFRQVLVIIALSVSITTFGVLIGLRLLSLIYKLPLDSLAVEFAILLAGGGLVALYNYLYHCITIMRRQGSLLVQSAVVAATALIMSNIVTSRFGISGACWSYFLLTFLEAAGSIGLIGRFYCQAVQDEKSEKHI